MSTTSSNSNSPTPNQDLVRGAIAASSALGVGHATHLLYQSGGARILGAAGQRLVRSQVQSVGEHLAGPLASKFLAGASPAPSISIPNSVSGASRAAIGQAAGAVAGALGRAGAIGAVIDGGVGCVRAYQAYDSGQLSADEAADEVAREVVSGGLAAAAGTGAVALLAVLTGPVAWPVAFVVAGGTSMGAKKGLLRLFR